jgi:hypothetical protein
MEDVRFSGFLLYGRNIGRQRAVTEVDQKRCHFLYYLLHNWSILTLQDSSLSGRLLMDATTPSEQKAGGKLIKHSKRLENRINRIGKPASIGESTSDICISGQI